MIWLNTTNVNQRSGHCTTWEYPVKWKSLLHIAYSCCYTGGIEAACSSLCFLCWLLKGLFFNLPELNLFVGQLTPRQKASKSVQHAFSVQRAQAMGNYVKLCELYNDAPFMGAYIMDHFIDRERMKAMMVITKACVSSLAFTMNLS